MNSPSLAPLVGAHPDALRALFAKGRAADPAELGDHPHGRLLAFGEGEGVFLALRPIVRVVSHSLLPWEGKTFDHGGNSGKSVILGRQVFRFHAEVAASALDGQPALVLSHAEPAHKNPWPVRAIVEELRAVGDGVAIGPVWLRGASASPRLLGWFGLEART